MRIHKWKVLAGCLLILSGQIALALGVTPEMQRRIRGATFEVVQKKPDKDSLSYEKPLPLELLPYLERTDAYRSIGTAVALGNNTYVTAGHVFSACVASQYGSPALRTPDGRVYAVDKILKFSAHEDFVVFSLMNDPAPTGLLPSRTPVVDDVVLAVGNALGEGIVIREGLFTSETPEDQDGRWKWIRFSAAASPGNSGGPLLDESGQVIGIVIGKSPNENLNYALPISRVLDAPMGVAVFDQRSLRSLPLLNATTTYQIKDSFVLPKAWAEFSVEYQRLMDVHNSTSHMQLQQANREVLFPKGKGAETILYDVVTAEAPRLIVQDGDKNWRLFDFNYQKTDLAADGFVEVSSAANALLLHLRRPENAIDAAFYSDSRGFMDLALHGLNLTRQVGSDAVKITSLGAAISDVMYTDEYGRRWQKRVWAVPFLDAYLIALLLPSPDGYAGMLAYSPSPLLRETTAQLEWSVRSFYFSYRGTLSQWQAFLSRRDQLPDSLKTLVVSVDNRSSVWRIAHDKAAFNLPKEVVDLDGGSILGVEMGYLADAAVRWVPVGVTVAHDESFKRYLKLVRRAKVPATAPRELRDDWRDLLQKLSPYTGIASRESDNSWTSRSVIDVPGEQPQSAADDVVYVLTSHVENVSGQEAARVVLNASANTVQILEKGSGTRAVNASSPVASAEEKEADEFVNNVVLNMIRSYGEQNSEDFRDERGRIFADDLREFVFTADVGNELRRVMVALRVAQAGNNQATTAALVNEYRERQTAINESRRRLDRYWKSANQINALRGNWNAFLSRNKFPTNFARSGLAASQEKRFHELTAGYHDHAPDETLIEAGEMLVRVYLDERRELFTKIESQTTMDTLVFNAEFSRCSAVSPLDTKEYVREPTKEARVNLVTSKSADDYFPRESQLKGQQGTVMVAAHLDAEGCVVDSTVVVSAGVAELDAAALRYTNEGMRFHPATMADKAVPTIQKFAVSFKF